MILTPTEAAMTDDSSSLLVPSMLNYSYELAFAIAKAEAFRTAPMQHPMQHPKY